MSMEKIGKKIEELYTGQHYKLTSIDIDNAREVIVTLHYIHNNLHPAVSAQYFADPVAQGLFYERGIAEYHIVSNKNDWFQHEEIFTLLDIIKKRHNSERKFFYGSSMGGFGAINLSYYLDAEFIAFSPQSTLDRNTAPYDERWHSYFEQISTKMNNIESGLCNTSKGLVFCDSMHIDYKHALRIKERTSCELIDIKHSGHRTLRILNSAVSVKDLVARYVKSEINIDTLKEEIYCKLNSSYLYNICLSKHIAQTKPVDEFLDFFMSIDICGKHTALFREMHQLCMAIDDDVRKIVANYYLEHSLFNDEIGKGYESMHQDADYLYFHAKILQHAGYSNNEILRMLEHARKINNNSTQINRFYKEIEARVDHG